MSAESEVKMKKVLIALSIVAISAGAFARPHHGGFHHPPVYHHHHHSYWGHGGHGFWPGFVGGVVGGAIVSSVIDTRPVVVTQPAVVTQPVVVQQPVVVTQPQPGVVQPQPVVVQQPVQQTQQVWVEGRYVDQVQANGSTVRIWQPGHYEQRTAVP